jgi:hypothetical protein
MLGQLDNPAGAMSIELYDETTSTGMYTSNIAWDGEAFAIHTTSRTERYVTRVSPEGQILLPGRIFGMSGADPKGIFGADYSTDPVSGNTYMFWAINGGIWAIGHDRQGNPFDWLAADSHGTLPLPGSSMFADQGAVGADENGGAWLSWALDYYGDGTLGMMAYLNSQGQVEDPVEFGPVEPGGRAPADKQVVRGLSGGGASAYSLGNDQLYVRTFSRGAIGVPRRLLQVAGAREMDARNYGDERWLGLHAVDYLLNDYLWFVKDIDGCVYNLN